MPAQAKKSHENQYLGEIWQSANASKLRLESAPQLRVAGPRQPVRRRAGAAETVQSLNLLSMTPAASGSRMPSGVHPPCDISDCQAWLDEFAARSVDLEFGNRFPVGIAPAEQVLAAAPRGVAKPHKSLFCRANQTD